ncbi:plasmid stabilization system protein [Caballeronia arationis]|jgi:plasmid stabilization system protein ParE|uniref:ParE toxin of type II toxin-antitoxin system, parDE n=1 Tax=Caballeronia arationis TaxID=1777142 RepID=A0A7Z7I2F8_9BURK|nr:type II toxin-antitoxin system RelE/ParE family toxin [Caballeronia arationis]SAL02061.1 plasmid stabilization system protein [Caballeronia arationis]SOE55571.1 ParE toxin of type II toxin-antitoxin system, parDE [Caballeronia arationis]
MTYAVRFTLEVAADLDRLYDLIPQRDATNFTLAEAAIQAVCDGFAALRSSPFTCRKARSDAPFLRSLIIPFELTGYVALFEIEDSETVTVLAIRHQLEDDYH